MAISIVQTTALLGTSSTGANQISLPSVNNTAGNLSVIAIRTWHVSGSGVPTVTISDSASNSYSQAGSTYSASGGSYNDASAMILFAPNINSYSGNVITAKFDAPVSHTAVIYYEVSGCATSSPLDATAGAGNNSSLTSLASSSFSTTEPNEIIILIGASAYNASATWAAGNIGGTLATLDWPTSSGGLGVANSEHLIVSSLQSGITGAMSWTPAGGSNTVALASFKGAVQPITNVLTQTHIMC